MLDWLILGGGIHGTHLSLVLTQRYRVPADRVRVLDPHPVPLARWQAMTAAVGMTYLRSPLVHHLHYDQRGLGVFARIQEGEPMVRFISPFSRPSLALFDAYNQYLITKYRLDTLRITGRAMQLTPLTDGWRVETAAGALEARRVMVATGGTEQPDYPEWAAALKQVGAPVRHIFDLDFQRERIPPGARLAIIGGGITAAQVALSLAASPDAHQVLLLLRHPLRVHDFDSDPCWLNALCLRDFHRTSDLGQRRAMIQAARHRGSMPPDVARHLSEAVSAGQVQTRLAEVTAAAWSAPLITLHLADGSRLAVDQVLLATGFARQRPGGAWLDAAIARWDLLLAADGYPIVDQALQWQGPHRGLHVSGGLAELEIGPAARNIIGARLAGERLAALV